MDWTLEPGETIRRVHLHDRYGGGRQGGISPSRQSPNVLIFSDPVSGEQHGYNDRWEVDVFHYVGEGQTGSQEMMRGNAAILNHVREKRALRIFWGARGTVQYSGEYELADPEPWYLTDAPASGTNQLRQVITFRLVPVGETTSNPNLPAGDARRENRRIVRLPRVTLTTAYRRAREDVTTSARDPFEVDPNVVDRGLAGHAATQNSLAAFLEERGVAPLSPGAGDPDFDLAWLDEDLCTVVEIKSLTPTNQDRQLRLGLGQVLDYHHLLETSGRTTRAALAVEREPSDPRWAALCARHSVALVWPGVFERLFESEA